MKLRITKAKNNAILIEDLRTKETSVIAIPKEEPDAATLAELGKTVMGLLEGWEAAGSPASAPEPEKDTVVVLEPDDRVARRNADDDDDDDDDGFDAVQVVEDIGTLISAFTGKRRPRSRHRHDIKRAQEKREREERERAEKEEAG